MTQARPLPHSIEAEEHLIGCCLLDGAHTIAICAAAGLTPLSFYGPSNQIIFGRLTAMVAEQRPIEASVLAEELKSGGQLESIGGYAQLARIVGQSATSAQATYFAERIRELHQLRELIVRSTRLIETCFTSDSTGAIKDQITPLVDGIASVMRDREGVRTWAQAINEAEALTRERIKPPAQREMKGMEISWGIQDFDNKFQPLEPGEVVVIGGYTSVGKSSLLRQILWSTAGAGHSSLEETIEVRDTEEAINLAGHLSGLRTRTKLHELHQKDQSELLRSYEAMRAQKKFSVCHQDISLSSMLSRAKAVKQNRGLAVLGIDYLQILLDVKNYQRGETQATAISRVTSELKRFSTTENIVTILLSGFNRDYIRAGGRPPVMSDLDGSSSIEKDASRIILLDVPGEYRVGDVTHTQDVTADSSDTPRFYVRVTQVKGRNQGTSSLGMFFQRETKTFHQISRSIQPDKSQEEMF